MEARSCRLSEFLGVRVSPTPTLSPPLPPVSRPLISAGLAEGGSPKPQTAAGRAARTAGATVLRPWPKSAPRDRELRERGVGAGAQARGVGGDRLRGGL